MRSGPSITAVRTQGVLLVSLLRPVLAEEVLVEIGAVLATRFLGGVDPMVLGSSHPTVFAAGADLGEIEKLDAAACVRYAELGRRVVRLLAEYPAPTVAAVRGSCYGGGFDLVLSCDRIIAGPKAVFQHPGVRRGLVTGWSGTTVLPETLGSSVARRVLVEGNPTTAAEMKDIGLVHEISDRPDLDAVQMAISLGALEPERFALWRSLSRPGFIDRFRATVVHKLR